MIQPASTKCGAIGNTSGKPQTNVFFDARDRKLEIKEQIKGTGRKDWAARNQESKRSRVADNTQGRKFDLRPSFNVMQEFRFGLWCFSVKSSGT